MGQTLTLRGELLGSYSALDAHGSVLPRNVRHLLNLVPFLIFSRVFFNSSSRAFCRRKQAGANGFRCAPGEARVESRVEFVLNVLNVC